MEDVPAFVDRGDNTYGGKFVVNPSGGLEAKGHPLGATGLGMHFYITSMSSFILAMYHLFTFFCSTVQLRNCMS